MIEQTLKGRCERDNVSKITLSKSHLAWAVFASQSSRLKEPAFKAEALQFSRLMMRGARALVLELIDELASSGYLFEGAESPHVEAEAGAQEYLAELWERGIFVPLSVQAWMIEVGCVNLCGSHPNWPKATYAKEGTSTHDVVYTDPFVVEVTPEYISYLIDERDSAPELAAEPFLLDVAPDHLHKANISGGTPYAVDASFPQVEPLLLYERHCTSFTDYVRRSIAWSGFPGMDYVEPNLLPILRKPYPQI
ncbi:MAG: hypothetical protein HUU03_05205 [Planctomycetaceae bacterium]|nr:hypothetical protein [Planctomycetota bacterium]NUO15822.1 hypothetical protein [Planctomycetaceae bacterium]HRJ78521.1 hypothetical protein [Planctomycetota bacterium]